MTALRLLTQPPATQPTRRQLRPNAFLLAVLAAIAAPGLPGILLAVLVVTAAALRFAGWPPGPSTTSQRP